LAFGKRFWCKISIGYKIWKAWEGFPTLYGSHLQLPTLFAPEPVREGLDRAVVSGESRREATLDYELARGPAQVRELEPVRDLSWVLEP
jgi:hypothetical protein